MTRIIGDKSRCWPGRSDIPFLRRRRSECGSGACDRLKVERALQMQKATILFNPNSGPRRREAELDRAIGVIQSAGVRTELTVCRSSEEATMNARFAVAGGSD